MNAETRSAEKAAAAVARRSTLWFNAFAAIFLRAIRSDFHAVRLSRNGCQPLTDTPHLIVYCNHPSWWDAAVIALLLVKLFPGRPGFAPIDAKMIASYHFMTRIGGFGVAQDSVRGAATFLATAREVLAAPERILFVTAQGRFTDVRERPVRLAPGLAHVLDSVPDATLLPLAIDYPFWDERKPELLLRFGPPISARALVALPRDARNDRLAAGLQTVMDALAEDAMARDPAAFIPLLAGRSGVGGIYDVWRRGKAALRGKRFVAAHGGQ